MTDVPNEHRALVEQLHEPRQRRSARQKLVAAKAVGALMSCLDSHNELVVWAAVESLGDLRASEAVEPLVGLLERGILTIDVTEALGRITGMEFGADVARWRKWLGQSPQARQAEAVDLVACLRRAGELLGVEPETSRNASRFRLSLPDERCQTVTVYSGRKDSDGNDIVVIYSECGPAESKLYEALLRKNMGMPDGAFALRDVDGNPTIVMVEALAVEVVTASVLAKKIEKIAAQADSIERVLDTEDKR